MGLLDGGGAALFGEVFARHFLPAVVSRSTPQYDARGDITRTAAQSECLAQVDRATDSMRRQPDYVATDRAIFVLASSLTGGLNEGDEIRIDAGPFAGASFRVAAPIERDPAGAYWLCRAVAGGSL